MPDYTDEHSVQNEDELRVLEDEQPREREVDRLRAGEARALPSPLYRIRSIHSNETFFAYFPPQAKAPAPPESAQTAVAEGDPSSLAESVQVGITEGTRDGSLEGVPVSDAELPWAEGAPADWTEASQVGSAESNSDLSTAATRADRLGEARAGGLEGTEAPPPPAARAETRDSTLSSRIMVVAPTRYGRDLCELQGIVLDPSPVGRDELVRIERVATPEDLRKAEANRERERKAYETCRQKIASRNLPMKLVSAHYLLEEPKVLFYFSAESRVDFRELVKDLVSVFKMRIELRQIGVRDEARVTGGCGVCGRVLCCHGVTDKLTPVSIKMAKDQNLSLNSMKISGPCGRLLCCLAYEYGFYRDARRELPNEGARFQYDGVLFRVVEVNPLAGMVKMAGEDGRILDMPAARFAFAEGRWQVRQEEQAPPQA